MKKQSITAADFQGFPKASLKFLKQLKANNNRDWFAEHKPRYESEVLTPALAFIAAMEAPMKRLSDCFNVIPKRMGGSLMRVYKDTRFAEDKTPFKTNIGIHFRHMAGKDVHAPGFYLNIAPEEIFVGIGVWHPDSRNCTAIRQHMDEHSEQWRKIWKRKAFREGFKLIGESLKRPPRGFSADHPLITDLKRKDFIVTRQLSAPQIHSPDFDCFVAKQFRDGFPLIEFLCSALDLPC